MAEYTHLKKEFEVFLKTLDLQEELLAVNASLSSWFIHYSEKMGISLPNEAGLHHLIKRTRQILDELKASRCQKLTEKKGDDKLTEPCIWYCYLHGWYFSLLTGG